MDDDWLPIFADASQAACNERALVLVSLDIPHQVLALTDGFALLVPAAFAERAKHELWEYQQENRPKRRQAKPIPNRTYDPLPGVLFYIGTIGLFAWLAGEAAFDRDWLAAGRVDGVRLRDGEWWRAVTALTLHLDLRHLLGNMGFGALFGFFAGRLAGAGVAWLTILLAATVANLLNAALLESAHRSIGASTAVFAALGLAAGFVWRGQLMTQERWPYRVGPIVGGVALLAFTGTGSENTDVGAHLMGFLCGFGGGMMLTRVAHRLGDSKLQLGTGSLAVAAVLLSWLIALA